MYDSESVHSLAELLNSSSLFRASSKATDPTAQTLRWFHTEKKSWSWLINTEQRTGLQTLLQLPVWFYMDRSSVLLDCPEKHCNTACWEVSLLLSVVIQQKH